MATALTTKGDFGPESWEGVRGGDAKGQLEDPEVGPARSAPGPQAAQAHPPLPGSDTAPHPVAPPVWW